MHENPWTTVDSTVVYENPWITVRHDDVIRPDGQPGVYGVVSTRTATGVLALTARDEVVLVGQYRYALDRYSWEIVEGGGDPGEDPQVIAARELREEAGLVASDWTPLGHEVHLSNSFTSEVGYLFLARDLTETPPEPDPTEVLEVRTEPLGRVMDMVTSGEITDAMSIIAILQTAAILA